MLCSKGPKTDHDTRIGKSYYVNYERASKAEVVSSFKNSQAKVPADLMRWDFSRFLFFIKRLVLICFDSCAVSLKFACNKNLFSFDAMSVCHSMKCTIATDGLSAHLWCILCCRQTEKLCIKSKTSL